MYLQLDHGFVHRFLVSEVYERIRSGIVGYELHILWEVEVGNERHFFLCKFLIDQVLEDFKVHRYGDIAKSELIYEMRRKFIWRVVCGNENKRSDGVCCSQIITKL